MCEASVVFKNGEIVYFKSGHSCVYYQVHMEVININGRIKVSIAETSQALTTLGTILTDHNQSDAVIGLRR